MGIKGRIIGGSMNLNFQTALVVCAIGLIGAGLQLAFWKSDDKSILDALLSHGYLWIAYLLIGVFIAEHVLNYFRRRKEKKIRSEKIPRTDNQ
jgi:hypothetical protein